MSNDTKYLIFNVVCASIALASFTYMMIAVDLDPRRLVVKCFVPK